jgi:hypothetical protein
MSMLRALALLLGLAMIGSGIALIINAQRDPGIYLMLLGAGVLAGTLFERWRYRAVLPRAAPGWQRTSERFVDPDSGEEVTVFYDPASGQRHYVSDPAAAGHRDPH